MLSLGNFGHVTRSILMKLAANTNGVAATRRRGFSRLMGGADVNKMEVEEEENSCSYIL